MTNYAIFLKSHFLNYFFLDCFFLSGGPGATQGAQGGPKKEFLTGYEILTGTQGYIVFFLSVPYRFYRKPIVGDEFFLNIIYY